LPDKRLMCLFINGIDHILANSIYCCITQSASRHNANSGPFERWIWVAPRGLAGTASLKGITHSTRKQKSDSIHKASQFYSSTGLARDYEFSKKYSLLKVLAAIGYAIGPWTMRKITMPRSPSPNTSWASVAPVGSFAHHTGRHLSSMLYSGRHHNRPSPCDMHGTYPANNQLENITQVSTAGIH